MTTIKVSKNTIIFTFFSLIVLMPAYITDQLSFVKMLSNVTAACMVLFLVKEKIQLSKFGAVVSVYYLYTVINSYFHGQGEIHFLISTAKMLFFVCVVDIVLSKRYEKTITILYVIFLIIIVADVLSVFLFPNGLYQTTTTWNEWSSSDVKGWLLGNKNNHIIWYLTTIYLSYVKYRMTDLKKYEVRWYIVMFITLVTVIHIQSSTSIVVAIIADVSMLYFHSRKKQTIHINIVIVGIVYVIMQTIILMGSITFLQPIITGVLGKDLTFSGRVTAWMNASVYIFQKPISGWGQMTAESAKKMLGSAALVNAHNQWLQILWEGGIIQLVLLMVVFVVMIRKIQQCSEKTISDISNILFTVVLIAMAFEVELGNLVSWVLIALFYHTNWYFDKHKEKQESLA